MRMLRWRRCFMGFMVFVAAPFVSIPLHAQDYHALLAAPDRSPADRENDKRRDPFDMLNFIQPRAGMKILDMGAGAGYSTELMARAAGPSGMVYGQNPPDQFEKARQAFDERAKSPAMKNAAQAVRPFDDPVPPGVHDLDMVTYLFFYHDTTYLPVDRAEKTALRTAAAVAQPFHIERAPVRETRIGTLGTMESDRAFASWSSLRPAAFHTPAP
jgi:predicted methyltransferase